MTRLADALRRDVVGGVLLLVAALVAVVWANSPWSSAYETVQDFAFGLATLHLHLSVQAWTADGLLALFFFVVGNELKEEFVHGSLRHPRRAVVPMVAAVCGVVVPAVIFVLINLSDPAALRGWGVPIATDAAFAVAVLAVVGRHLPPELRTFLLTLAVVDDLVAIVIIAMFYTGGLVIEPFAGAAALLVVFGLLQSPRGLGRALERSRVPSFVVYVPLAAAIWALVHASGVHATIAGVAMGLLMRTGTRPGETESPSQRAERSLRPWAFGLALPIFALTSAGVAFTSSADAFTNAVTVGVAVALVAGKLIGIAGGTWVTTRLTRAELDPALRGADTIAVGLLAGIGFTVSLLIATLSYPSDETMLDHAKGGVLIGSLVASVLAAVVLRARRVRPSGSSLSG